jgi:hypothetical protein
VWHGVQGVADFKVPVWSLRAMRMRHKVQQGSPAASLQELGELGRECLRQQSRVRPPPSQGMAHG